MGLKSSVNLNLGLLEMTFIKHDGVGEYLKGLFLYGPSWKDDDISEIFPEF